MYFLHGYSNSYSSQEELMNRLAEAGFRVHAWDMRGHGRNVYLNKGQSSFLNIESLEKVRQDIPYFMDAIDKEEPAPKFLVILIVLAHHSKIRLATVLVLGPFSIWPSAIQTFTTVSKGSSFWVILIKIFDYNSFLAPAFDFTLKFPSFFKKRIGATAESHPDHIMTAIMPPRRIFIREREVRKQLAQDPYHLYGLNLNTGKGLTASYLFIFTSRISS